MPSSRELTQQESSVMSERTWERPRYVCKCQAVVQAMHGQGRREVGVSIGCLRDVGVSIGGSKCAYWQFKRSGCVRVCVKWVCLSEV